MRLYVLLVVVAMSDAGSAGSALADKAPTSLNNIPDVAAVRLYFNRGAMLYGDGRYAEAIVEFEAARAAEALPAIDYDLARCYDRLERAREAIDAYERFVAAAPNDPDAAVVIARTAVLRQRLTDAAPVRILDPLPVVPPPAPPRRHIYTWIVGGAGAAILAGSLASGLYAHARYEDLAARCAPDGICDPGKVSGAQGLIDEGRSAGIASDVLLGVGVATVAVGVAIYIVEGRHRAAWIAHTVGGRGAGLTMGGAW